MEMNTKNDNSHNDNNINHTQSEHVVLKRSFAPIALGPWHDEHLPSYINHKLHPFPPMWAQ